MHILETGLMYPALGWGLGALGALVVFGALGEAAWSPGRVKADGSLPCGAVQNRCV